jgi:hypothetical protein
MDQVRARLCHFCGVIAGGPFAGTVSVLLAEGPLKKSVNQEITRQNAKCEKRGKRHIQLTLTAVQALPAREKD